MTYHSKQNNYPPLPDTVTNGTPAQNAQRNAIDFLYGNTPGVMRHYAPDARCLPGAGVVEDDETVERLRRYREEFPYG